MLKFSNAQADALFYYFAFDLPELPSDPTFEQSTHSSAGEVTWCEGSDFTKSEFKMLVKGEAVLTKVLENFDKLKVNKEKFNEQTREFSVEADLDGGTISMSLNVDNESVFVMVTDSSNDRVDMKVTKCKWLYDFKEGLYSRAKRYGVKFEYIID